jgi:hypothetical protein
MLDDQPIMLPEQGQEMREHTPHPQPPAPAPRPRTPELRPQLPTPETHHPSGLENLELVTLQKPRPAVPTLEETEAAGNTSVMDVNQQRLIKLAGGESLSAVPLPNVPLYNVPHPNVPLPKAHPDSSVGEE